MITSQNFTTEIAMPDRRPSLLQKLFRALVTFWSSPKGDQGGWEVGARSL
jgi:hypothetical protein